MRPRAIRQAEGVYLASVGFMLGGSVLQWPLLQPVIGTGPLIGTLLFSTGLWLLLVMFAMRKGQNWARWGLVIVTAFAVLSFLWQVASGQVPLGLIGLCGAAQTVLTAIGAVLLFRPAASRWFARPHADWAEDA